MGYEPDILAKGLDVVFCGINPAATAAIAGHNFSHGSNRFWRVLHLSGFTDVQLPPAEERRLLDYRCGITAAVRRPSARANEIPAAEFRASRSAFEAKMRRYSPRVVAFLGKQALSAMSAQASVPWGLQADRFADAASWVLPNPSGLNRSFSLNALVEAYAELNRWLRASAAVTLDKKGKNGSSTRKR